MLSRLVSGFVVMLRVVEMMMFIINVVVVVVGMVIVGVFVVGVLSSMCLELCVRVVKLMVISSSVVFSI